MNIRQRCGLLLQKSFHLTPDPPKDDGAREARYARELLAKMAAQQDGGKADYLERIAELTEARQMAGAGPWSLSPAALRQADRMMAEAGKRYGKEQQITVQESSTDLACVTTYDLEMALQTVEWRRDANYSWLEFSRYGIQQIILVCRLYFLKHPWIRRGVNLSAAYVFGQGVELSSPDPDANEALKRFRDRNKVSLGQIALTEQEKRKAYDGNLFWVLFADTQDKGETTVRVIEATEIAEIVCDPDDSNQPWYYKRIWSARAFNLATGQWETQQQQRWYPALNFNPPEKPAMIGKVPVQWDSPIHHRKVGHVSNWTYGCPRVYPAIDWAREGRKHLEACSSVTQALARVALDIQTKGGQQAVSGIQDQIQRGPSSDIRDLDGRSQMGSAFVHGPGTKIEAFKSRGAGTDPGDIKEYRNMVACVLEIPPTWLGDMETSNLSTAQTLDRPTELGFLLKQEEWQEDLVTMGLYALRVSMGAASGQLRDAFTRRAKEDEALLREYSDDQPRDDHGRFADGGGDEGGKGGGNEAFANQYSVRAERASARAHKDPTVGKHNQAARAHKDAATAHAIHGSKEKAAYHRGQAEGHLNASATRRSSESAIEPTSIVFREASRQQHNGYWTYEATKIKTPGVVEVLCNFPQIREGDVPALVKATADAMVIDRNGAAHGIDEKVAARKFYDLLGVDDGDERVEDQYPTKTYDPDRTKDPMPAVEPPPPGTQRQLAGAKEADRIRAAMIRVESALDLAEAGHRNGR